MKKSQPDFCSCDVGPKHSTSKIMWEVGEKHCTFKQTLLTAKVLLHTSTITILLSSHNRFQSLWMSHNIIYLWEGHCVSRFIWAVIANWETHLLGNRNVCQLNIICWNCNILHPNKLQICTSTRKEVSMSALTARYCPSVFLFWGWKSQIMSQMHQVGIVHFSCEPNVAVHSMCHCGHQRHGANQRPTVYKKKKKKAGFTNMNTELKQLKFGKSAFYG